MNYALITLALVCSDPTIPEKTAEELNCVENLKRCAEWTVCAEKLECTQKNGLKKCFE